MKCEAGDHMRENVGFLWDFVSHFPIVTYFMHRMIMFRGKRKCAGLIFNAGYGSEKFDAGQK
jgi:hypothetical protein